MERKPVDVTFKDSENKTLVPMPPGMRAKIVTLTYTKVHDILLPVVASVHESDLLNIRI